MNRDTRALNVKNNNPLNIRFNENNNWIGQIGENRGFVVFDSVEHGFRAAKRIFQSYKNRGLVTLEQIISEWAPDSENHTQNYIDFVSNRTNIAANEIVNIDDAARLMLAMSLFEGPNNFTLEQAENGVALA